MSTAWSISGEYVEACSCAFLCPCIPSNAMAPATEDFCRFAMTYRIDAGRFDAIDLAGVTFAVVAESKAIMSQGDWIMGVIVDERATNEQADAVAQIASGQAGGPMPPSRRWSVSSAASSGIRFASKSRGIGVRPPSPASSSTRSRVYRASR